MQIISCLQLGRFTIHLQINDTAWLVQWQENRFIVIFDQFLELGEVNIYVVLIGQSHSNRIDLRNLLQDFFFRQIKRILDARRWHTAI